MKIYAIKIKSFIFPNLYHKGYDFEIIKKIGLLTIIKYNK